MVTLAVGFSLNTDLFATFQGSRVWHFSRRFRICAHNYKRMRGARVIAEKPQVYRYRRCVARNASVGQHQTRGVYGRGAHAVKHTWAYYSYTAPVPICMWLVGVGNQNMRGGLGVCACRHLYCMVARNHAGKHQTTHYPTISCMKKYSVDTYLLVWSGGLQISNSNIT